VPTHVALLRGINVGGRNKVAMGDLRAVVASLGHTDVATYIQSGNVLFTTRGTDDRAIAAALEEAIAGTLGVRAAVVVVSRGELARVVAGNPYADEADPKRVHAIFYGDEAGAERVAAVAAAEQRAAEQGGRDAATVAGRVVYLHTPDGLGRSKLAEFLSRTGTPGLRPGGTARNWATVTQLLTRCGA
jgi:uncharacterized protein (DUF1697 family)